MNTKLKMIEHFIFMADLLNGDIDKYSLISNDLIFLKANIF
jgi:hypothetical protein